MIFLRNAFNPLFLIVFFSVSVACSSGGSGGSNPTSSADSADADTDGVPDISDNCPDLSNADQSDSDLNGAGDACDPLPLQYSFDSQLIAGESAVAYSGQTVRHLLITDLVSFVLGLSDDPGAVAQLPLDLDFYIRGPVDSVAYQFTLSGETTVPGPTYGDISSGKDLVGKIAGNDKPEHIIDGEFFGWQEGLDSDPLPIELVDYWLGRLAAEATDGFDPSISTAAGAQNIGRVTVDSAGRDYRQLLQKFLLGAVAFSQGTADYLKTDFAATNQQEDSEPYTAAEHDWDEAFGYFGAARDYNDYTDDEIRASGADRRVEYQNGYHDTNGDGNIDLRSEINVGHAVNCAKRDAGATVATDFTRHAFAAFILGRQILNNAVGGSFTDEQLATIAAQALIIATTWEKCIAATAVHYINDVISDMNNFSGNQFADLDNFLDLAKHWSEMKGFALSLQFNPDSPFRSGAVANIDINDLKQVLDLMGDAPVLPDGSQTGVAPIGSADQAIADYISGLLSARDILQTAYAFDAQNVANW